MEEERAYPNGRGELYEDWRKMSQTADRETDSLLILAHSAALLLESGDNFHQLQNNNEYEEGQEHIETDEIDVETNLEMGRAALFLEGKVRLSQVRQLARSKNRPLALQKNGVLTLNNETLGDEHLDNHMEGLAAGHIQEAIGVQDTSVASYNFKDVDGAHEYDAVIRELCDSPIVHGLQETKVNEEKMGHKNDADHAAQSSCEKIAHGRKQPSVAEPLLLNGGTQNATTEHHGTSQNLVQMANGVGDLREHQRLAREARLIRTNKIRGKQQITVSQLDQVHELAEKPLGQMPASAEKEIGQVCVIEPQWLLENPWMPMDEGLISQQRQELRSFERGKRFSDAQNQECLMVEEPWKQISEGNMLNVQIRETCKVSQQRHGHVSDLQQKEHHRLAARMRRAERARKQRASQNVRKCLNNHQLNVERDFDGGRVPPPVMRSNEVVFQHPVTTVSHEGQCMDFQLLEPLQDEVEVQSTMSQANGLMDFQHHEPLQVEVEVQSNMSQANGRMRFSQLKREARLRSTNLFGRR